MREKNIKRAAHGLYLSQGDDKNKLLAKYVKHPEAKEIVKDQGRALIVLEKLVLPQGEVDYEEDEMFRILYKKLKKKGHRIQDDESEDDEQYAKEKADATEARLSRVPTFLGLSLQGVEEEAQEKAVDQQQGPDKTVTVEDAPSTVPLPPTRTIPLLTRFSNYAIVLGIGIVIGGRLEEIR